MLLGLFSSLSPFPKYYEIFQYQIAQHCSFHRLFLNDILMAEL